MAIILLTSSSSGLSMTPEKVERYFVPAVNNWYDTVSYRNFAWDTVELAGPLTVSPPACDSQFQEHLLQTAQSAAGSSFNPASWKTIVVIYPHGWCPGVGFASGQWAALSDLQAISSSSPTAEQYYSSLHELGHTVFGSAHADALHCEVEVAYSQSCLSESLGKHLPGGGSGDPYPCVNGGYSLPAICQYGDPFDPMGNDWPGQRVPNSEFPNPPYMGGAPWPNGVELDHVGWLASRKQNVSMAAGTTQIFDLSPIEEQTPLHKQFLFVEPTANMTPWLEIEYRNPPAGTSRWTDGFLTAWPSVTGGVLLHLASGLKGKSLSALLDTTPGSNPPSLCAKIDNAFCDFYDAALTPGNVFVAGGGDYEVRVREAGPVGVSTAIAQVEISRCPCEEAEAQHSPPRS
jgi:hypothetical protein